MLFRMRWSKYPTFEDFDHITDHFRVWHFLTAGRLFQALMTSMYMLSRRDNVFERRELLRLYSFFGTTSIYFYASPRGDELLFQSIHTGISNTEIEEDVSKALLDRREPDNRTWFHTLHWKLQRERRSVQIGQWLSIIRQSLPINPTYLSGIDWSWLDEILPKVRIVPFRVSTDGPYALLLRDVEEKRRDSTTLRTAIEPYAVGLSCEDFVNWLISTYDKWAVSFVRYFLTPENIMLLGLAPNMMAALSERISALEACVAAFEFSDLLTEEQLEQEQQTLISALMLLTVSANQFEIPWDTFRRDVDDRQADNFNAYVAMRSGDQVESPQPDGTTVYPYRFSNGRVIRYTLKTSLAPLVVVLCGVIDSFLEHPSYGLEAILSTRFRHDTLRREYVFTFDSLSNSYIPGVVPNEQKNIIDVLSEPFLQNLDTWLFDRVQTNRPGFEKAIFDCTPSQEQLDELLVKIGRPDSISGVVDPAIDWLSDKIFEQLATARRLFIEEFHPSSIEVVNATAEALGHSSDIDASIVGRVCSAVQSTLFRRTEELAEWFKTPDQASQKPLTLTEIKMAVEGRFEQYVRSGTLKIALSNCEEAKYELPAEKVRLYFDLLSEVVQNAIKYGGKQVTRVRIRPFRSPGLWGFTYSSAASADLTWQRIVSGHRYLSLSDALFREGNSGLDKIGAIAASISETEVELIAERRKHSFHLQIPLGKKAGVSDGGGE